MMHEQKDHFVKDEKHQTSKEVRADQIMRLLMDIGFLPSSKNAGAAGNPNDD